MTLLQTDFEFGATLQPLRSLFGSLDGFTPCPESPQVTHLHATVVPVGEFRGWMVTVCEMSPGHLLPDYAARRAWRDESGSGRFLYATLVDVPWEASTMTVHLARAGSPSCARASPGKSPYVLPGKRGEVDWLKQ